MEDIGGGYRRALDTVGGLLDLEDRLEDVQKIVALGSFEFAVLDEFFALSTAPSAPPPCKPGGSWHRHHRLPLQVHQAQHKEHEKQGCVCLRSTFLKVWLLLFWGPVWPLMQFLFSSLFNNKWGFFGRFSRSGH